MMSYNLLNTPWINVRYLSGEIKEIGIRKAFMDADKIFDITSPVFHKDRAYIYDVLVYKLLASIVMSAYYKEETGYASKNLVYRDELISGDLYNDVIKAYLDKYEDRFDLYSETHPFLQNINLKNALKDRSKDDSSFKSYSLLVPAANSPVFGKYRSLDTTKEKVWDQYDISDKEFAYIVLYHAVMGRASCAAQYRENSLSSTASAFVIPKGKTLKETILMHIYPLKENARPSNGQDKPDAPVWEWDSVYEAEEYPASDMHHNSLACSFYPGISILGIKEENDDFVQNILKATGKEKPFVGLSPDNTSALEKAYWDKNAIRRIKTETSKNKESKSYFDSYINFEIQKHTAPALCLCATERINGSLCCEAINEFDEVFSDRRLCVYFRTFDSKKANILSIGVIDGGLYDTWLILKDPDNHAVAIEYQKKYETIKACLRKALKDLFNTDEHFIQNVMKQFNDYFEKDFFGQFTQDLKDKKDGLIDEAAQRFADTALKLFDRETVHTDKIFESVPIRNSLYYELQEKKGQK